MNEIFVLYFVVSQLLNVQFNTRSHQRALVKLKLNFVGSNYAITVLVSVDEVSHVFANT